MFLSLRIVGHIDRFDWSESAENGPNVVVSQFVVDATDVDSRNAIAKKEIKD